MNSDVMPIEIALVLLAEFLFGVGYNVLVAWSTRNRLMHVSVAVAIGVAGTLVIPTAVWFDNELQFGRAMVLMVLCFTASGLPMIVGSTRRTAEAKDNKKRRPLPNAAMRVRDEAVMDLMSLAHEIADRSKANALTVRDLPDYVNRLHSVIGGLKSI